MHLCLIIGSIVILAVSWKESHKTAEALRIFIAFMAVTSAARIFKNVYDRRWPLSTTTEWGTEIVRPVNTYAGKAALFIQKNIELVCFFASMIIIFYMDRITSEDAEKHIPILFWGAMGWAMLYFLRFVAPVFFILGLIACLPCIIVILQRFFNFSLINPNEHPRAAPATQAVLEKVWKVKYTTDEFFKYINPDEPEQVATIQKEDTKCSICLGWYDNGEELRILPCSHHFHQGCADEWFKITATCPLCVRPIRPTPSPTISTETADESVPADNPDSNV